MFEPLRFLIGDKSVQYTNGDEWRAIAKVLYPPFNHNACVMVLPKINVIANGFCDHWASLADDEHIPLHETMMALATKIVSSTHFGAYFKSDQSTKEFQRICDEVIF